MYEQQILRILLDVGARGISVKKLAKHVYNLNCTLFSQPNFADVHYFTQQYLLTRSRTAGGLVESTGQWGHYRLRQRAAQELELKFRDEAPNPEPEADPKPAPDLSLSLF